MWRKQGISAKGAKKNKTRLDLLLVQKGIVESREKAKALIMARRVEVNNAIIDKPGHMVSVSSSLLLKETLPPYVSRGGQKLEAALKHFHIDVKGLTMIDVGASTGGFTDCLLQHGALKVIAVDVGYGQLDWKLRNDARVEIFEKTNARYLKPEDFIQKIKGAVIDVSFISLKLVVPPLTQLLEKKAFIVALIKPQFEVGKGLVGKGGVVRDPNLHREVIENLSDFFEGLGWFVQGHIPSPLLGPKGNREFLIYANR